MPRSADSGIWTSTRVSDPARSGTILARISSSQPSCRASWNRCAAVRSSSGPRFFPSASSTAVTAAAHSGVRSPARRPAPSMVESSWSEAVLEALAGRVVVGMLGAPGLVGGLGDDPQPVQVRPGPGGLQQDLVGVAPHLLVADPAGPAGHLPRPRGRHRAFGGGVVQQRVPAEEAHLPDGRLGVLAPEAGAGGEPGGGGGVAVGVVGAVGVEPAQQPGLRRRQPGRDRADRDQGLPAGGAVQVAGGRGVEVVRHRLPGAQRLRHAGEPRARAAGRRGRSCRRCTWRTTSLPGSARWLGGMPGAGNRDRGGPLTAGRLLPSRLTVRPMCVKGATKIIYSKLLILV